jgi:tellurite methyltransferase
VQRPITSFALDQEAHWTATLSCGHLQHTRHNPPILERPWVLSEEGRASRIGTELDCFRCDRFEMPDGHAPYQRTPDFNHDSVPASLRKSHSTKAGVWALIHVVSGSLRYGVEPPVQLDQVVTPEAPGIVVPELLHHVEPLGDVEFYVEFWKSL